MIYKDEHQWPDDYCILAGVVGLLIGVMEIFAVEDGLLTGVDDGVIDTTHLFTGVDKGVLVSIRCRFVGVVNGELFLCFLDRVASSVSLHNIILPLIFV